MITTISLQVIRIIQETADTVTLQFIPSSTDFAYQSGQSITLIFNHLSVKPFRRTYSFSSTPKVDKYPAITVKRQVNGLASTYLTRDIRVGDKLTALSPAGQFTLSPKPEMERDIILVGGGSGVTPLFSILKKALSQEKRSRILLILANRNEHHIIFRNALEQWSQHYPKRLKIIYLLSNPITEIEALSTENIQVLQSRFSNYLFERLIKKELRFPREQAQLFICGPEGLALKAQMTLKFMGFTNQQVHREIFIIKNTFTPTADKFADSQVSVQFQSNTYTFPVTAGQTILQAAEAQGINLPYSCLSGICTTCAGTCTSGRVEMYTQEGYTDSEIGVGLVLTCVAYPTTPKVEMRIP